MKYENPNKNISFCVENCLFHTLNITHYHFENSLPDHSHGSNLFEIHYIANGYGKLKIGDTYYDLTRKSRVCCAEYSKLFYFLPS